MENEYLTCRLCGLQGKNLVTHIKYKHSLSSNDYKELYGNCRLVIVSDAQKTKLSKAIKKLFNDGVYNNKKTVSQVTISYWLSKGLSESEAIEKIRAIQQKNATERFKNGFDRKDSPLCVEYWTSRGFTEKFATKNIQNHQTQYSRLSSKFKGHKRTLDQKQRISKSLRNHIDSVGRSKWAEHFGKFNGRSKAEAEFYNYIKENVNSQVQANITIGSFIVDVIKDKKIIEFYGDFWHGNPEIFNCYDKLNFGNNNVKVISDIWEKDRKRIDFLMSNGYQVLIIWEMDWNKNREECLEKIKSYLL